MSGPVMYYNAKNADRDLDEYDEQIGTWTMLEKAIVVALLVMGSLGFVTMLFPNMWSWTSRMF